MANRELRILSINHFSLSLFSRTAGASNAGGSENTALIRFHLPVEIQSSINTITNTNKLTRLFRRSDTMQDVVDFLTVHFADRYYQGKVDDTTLGE
jgi:hypothetical protein